MKTMMIMPSFLANTPLRRVRHPYAALAITFAVIMSLVSVGLDATWLGKTPMLTVVCVGVQLFATVLLYARPLASAILIAALFSFAAFSTSLTMPLPIWSMWLSLGYAAYMQHTIVAVCIAAIETALQIISYQLGFANDFWTTQGIMTFSGFLVLSIITGYALDAHRRMADLQRQLSEQRQEHERHAHLLRDLALASDIHDSIARGLTLIALYTDQCRTQLDDQQASKQLLRDIADTVQETMKNTHRVIEILDSEEDKNSSENNGNDNEAMPSSAMRQTSQSFCEQLAKALQEHNERLRSLDFDGSSTLDIDDHARLDEQPQALKRELLDLLNTVYSNIALHGRRGADAYVVRINVQESSLSLTEFNLIGKASQHSHLGVGLDLHRRRLANFGGTLHCQQDDDLWITSIVIPLKTL